MNTQAFIDQTFLTISKYKMLEPGEAVIVAVSGGPDSTALLLSLALLSKKFDLKLHVWHLNHLIRAEAGKEAEHVRQLALKLGFPYTIEARDVTAYAKDKRISMQEAGRKLRYALMKGLSNRLGGAKIAVGHTADDSVETFFINLLRGSGLTGLCGIPPVSGAVIRPLIDFERAAIMDFLVEAKADYMSDPSNQDKRYLRNRIRLEVMPVLKEINPAVLAKIRITMSLLRDEQDWLNSLSEKEFSRVAEVDHGEVVLDAKRLTQSPPALKRRLLRLGVTVLTGSSQDIDYAAIESIIDKTAAGRGETNLRRGARAGLSGGDIILSSPQNPFKGAFIDACGGKIQIDHSLISVTIAPLATVVLPPEKGVLAVDAHKIDWPLEVRARQAGDWFFPLGMRGKKKLQDFFVDAKVPRRHRDSVPIFVDKNKLVAVGNMRIDDRVKVSEGTREIAVIRSPDIIGERGPKPRMQLRGSRKVRF